MGDQGPEVASGDGQLDGGEVADGGLVEPGADRPVPLEPPDALLDARPPPARGPVEPVPPVVRVLVPAVRDDGPDARPIGLLLLVYRPTAPRFGTFRRTAVGLILLAAILGRLLEIALFAGGYALVAPSEVGGGFDAWYHSAAAYTALGDSQSGGARWRLMTPVEALTGFVLITWAAPFTLVVIQRNWEQGGAGRPSHDSVRVNVVAVRYGRGCPPDGLRTPRF